MVLGLEFWCVVLSVNDTLAHQAYLGVAVCCSVLRRVVNETRAHPVYLCAAVCCSVLQCIVACHKCYPHPSGISMCCSVLQCIAVYCSVLQRVAACCSLLTILRRMLRNVMYSHFIVNLYITIPSHFRYFWRHH